MRETITTEELSALIKTWEHNMQEALNDVDASTDDCGKKLCQHCASTFDICISNLKEVTSTDRALLSKNVLVTYTFLEDQ